MKLFLTISILFTTVVTSFAQPEIKLRVSNNQVRVGSRIKVVYEANKECKFDLPNSFVGFEILSGPNPMTSVSQTYINGQFKQEKKLSYTYYLQAQKKGKFNLPKASMTCNGKSYSSNSVAIHISEGANGVQEIKTNSKIFGSIRSNKKSVYVGEPFQVIYKVYSRYQIVNFVDVKFGSFNNLWHDEINKKQQLQLEQEVVNGQRYYVVEIKKEVCIPNTSGTAKIDAFDAEIVISYSFFNQGKKKLNSNTLELEVKPLPEGAPNSFNGAVGKYNLTANISKNKLKTGEGLDLKMTLSGEGNIHLIDQLDFEPPKSFDVFEPDVKESLSYNAKGAKGKIDYAYLMTPGKKGKYKLGPVAFSYFDLETKNYKTIQQGPFEVEVEQGKQTYNPHITLKKTVDSIQTLRYIKTEPPASFSESEYWGNKIWYYCLTAFIPLTIVFGVWSKKREKNADHRITKQRSSKADKYAVSKLKKAKSYLDDNDYNTFNTELAKALYQYLEDKFDLPQNNHDKSSIKNVFNQKNISEDTQNSFIAILESTEMAKYAQMEGTTNHKLYDNAVKTIGHIEKECRS